MKLGGQHINQNGGGEDATESSQENELQTLPVLLERLFTLRKNEQLSNMSSRLLALENQNEQFQFVAD